MSASSPAGAKAREAPADRPPRTGAEGRSDRLRGQLRWLIALRLVVITSLVVPYLLLQMATPGEAPSFDFLYLIGGATYLASLIYLALFKLLWNRPEIQAYLQFLGDLLLVTGLVYHFGGLASPFSILYFVVIIVASALLRRRAGLVVATLAWLLYTGIVLALQFGWIPAPSTAPVDAIARSRMVYNLAVHFFGFYGVAFLTTYLAQSVVQAESELEARGEDLADLRVVHSDVIESIPSGLISCDPEGVVTSLNRAGSDILRLPATQLVGQPIWQSGLFTASEWNALRSRGRAADRSRQEVAYRCPGGEEKYIGYALSRLTSTDGRPTGTILIFQDLTDWRQLQEEVQLKDRMAAVGEMAAGIAHEIGNPLAAISGSAQMLSTSFHGESSERKLLDITIKESQRLDRTIKSFLQFARPRERSDVRFDVAKLLSENLKLLHHSPEVSEEHQLELELDPPSVTLVADPDQVSQVFWNLARNALRAMPGGGRLLILGRLENETYKMSFIDGGHGMTDDERARLFDPFQSFFDGGTGIGMAIVYRIVQQHQGRLSVESRPGEGTSITVELPAATASASDGTVET